MRRERQTRREARGRRDAPVVALVGYTNAGKSTLFNALTRGSAVVSDQLFMTLDPLVRKVRLGPGREMLLVDTVGFIQKLPHSLVAAFRATLEEVTEADLLLHVVDASAPASRSARRRSSPCCGRSAPATGRASSSSTRRTARRRSGVDALAAGRAGCVVVSAVAGDGLDGLLATAASRLDLEPRRVRLRFRAGDRRGVSGVYAAGRVLGHEEEDGHVVLEAELPGRALERYREHLL